MKMKKALSLLMVLAVFAALLPANAFAASGLSRQDAEAYKNVIDAKTRDGLEDVNSYLTDFDGDGRNELFLIWLTNTDYETPYLWNYQYEVWLGSRRLTEGRFGYWAAGELCVDSLGRTRLVYCIYDDGLEENITDTEEYIRNGEWVADTYNLHTPVDLMHPEKSYPTEYKGPNGLISYREYTANVARLRSYTRIRRFSVYAFQDEPDAPRFVHSAWNEITAAIDPVAFSWKSYGSSFDGTYWIISNGATLASTYYICMRSDGNYDFVNGAMESGSGAYYWENNRLWIMGGYLRWNGREFHAEYDEQRWNGWPNGGFYKTCTPDPDKTYAKLTHRPMETPQESPTIGVEMNGFAVRWTDVRPFIDSNDRTMVPLRAVAEALGLEVQWDSATRTASFRGTVTDKMMISYQAQVDFQIGNADATITYTRLSGGPSISETIRMDTVPVIVNDRTFAPIRYLAEAFGYYVGWNGQERKVELFPGFIEKPNFPSAALSDGVFNGLIRRETVIQNPDGTESAEVELRDFILFTDAEVRSLAVGGTLVTPNGEYYISMLRWVSNELIDINGAETLERGLIATEPTKWAWCVGGLPIEYTTDYAQVQITSATAILDSYTHSMTGYGTPRMRRGSISEFFNSSAGSYCRDIDVRMTVSGGKVTEIIILYRP